jgi:signal transduction histidine kinase/ActR/RegA family two-component response regulator
MTITTGVATVSPIDPSDAGDASGERVESLALARQPLPARAYVVAVIVAGALVLVASAPRTLPAPGLFVFALLSACLTSAWKVNLPIPLASGSTLSVSYAADLMALLLLGPRPATVIAAVGVWTQCTVNVKRRYPIYRTVFSIAAEVITMSLTGAAYEWLGGSHGPFDVALLTKPLVGAIGAYFMVNTALVAGAIALSTGRPLWRVWREDFFWSAASFIVAGSAGAMAAVVVFRGKHWQALLMLAPVYLTYWTYRLFVARLDEHRQHMAETRRLHQKTVEALWSAGQAERALAEEKERLAATLEEMTRLKQARERLLEREQTARTAAETANRLKDQFLATVSHELRTPLSAVLGWAEMLRSGVLDASRRQRASEAIFNNAKRQAQLIDELLDVARIMSGKLRLEHVDVDPREIVAGALEAVQPAAEARNIQIETEIDPALAAFYGDPPRLQQILWNLLSNAVKFTPPGGTVRVRVRRNGNAGEIVVSDTGAGIPADFLPAVFEPFRQADGSRTRRHGGLGLGLAIVKQLVEAHSGSVTVRSAGEGQGATFAVRLPIVPHGDRSKPPSAIPDRQTTVASLDGLVVLVVDDDAENRTVVAACLEQHGANVIAAASAAEGFDVLQRRRVDVLLADVAMPDEDGYTLVRRVRALPSAAVAMIPAAALTAFARDEDRQEALRAGFQMHLTKPIDAASLVSAVSSLANANAT